MDTIARRPRRRRREILTDAKVAELRFKKNEQPLIPDSEERNFYIRLQPDGPPHAFYVVARDPFGKQKWRRLRRPTR